MVKLSVFCDGWLLPRCVPASVGLSILGVGVARAVETLCIAGPQNFPPKQTG